MSAVLNRMDPEEGKMANWAGISCGRRVLRRYIPCVALMLVVVSIDDQDGDLMCGLRIRQSAGSPTSCRSVPERLRIDRASMKDAHIPDVRASCRRQRRDFLSNRP